MLRQNLSVSIPNVSSMALQCKFSERSKFTCMLIYMFFRK